MLVNVSFRLTHTSVVHFNWSRSVGNWFFTSRDLEKIFLGDNEIFANTYISTKAESKDVLRCIVGSGSLINLFKKIRALFRTLDLSEYLSNHVENPIPQKTCCEPWSRWPSCVWDLLLSLDSEVLSLTQVLRFQTMMVKRDHLQIFWCLFHVTHNNDWWRILIIIHRSNLQWRVSSELLCWTRRLHGRTDHHGLSRGELPSNVGVRKSEIGSSSQLARPTWFILRRGAAYFALTTTVITWK